MTTLLTRSLAVALFIVAISPATVGATVKDSPLPEQRIKITQQST